MVETARASPAARGGAARTSCTEVFGTARVTPATDHERRGRPGNRSVEEYSVRRAARAPPRLTITPDGHARKTPGAARLRSTASLETARATPAMIEHNEIRRDCKGSPRCSHSLHQPNVGLSCEPREQAERRASDALRSVGVRQIQARVGLCLGPSLASRSGQCRERLGVLTIPVGGLRPGAQPSGGCRRLRSSWTASCPIEREEREPLAPPAVRGSPGS